MHNEDPWLEEELRRALSRVEAPTGFADGVLGRIGREQAQDQIHDQTQEPVQQPALAQGASPTLQTDPFSARENLTARAERPRFRFPVPGIGDIAGTRHLAALAAALLFFLLLPVIGYLHQRHQQEQAQAAAQQFSLAMRLTHEALEDAGAHIATHRHSHTAD